GGLMLARQVRANLPVEFAGRGARGAAEVAGVDLSHGGATPADGGEAGVCLARHLRTHRGCRRVLSSTAARHPRAFCEVVPRASGRFSSINEQDTRAESREASGAAGGEFPASQPGSLI